MDNCIIWHGELSHNGYGRRYIRRDGVRKKVRIHRYEWEKHHGPIPDGLFVLHKCDNRRCYNIDHLELGTHQDNMTQMVERGRGDLSVVHSDEVVADIKEALERGERHGVIAARFNCSNTFVSNIYRGIDRAIIFADAQ